MLGNNYALIDGIRPLILRNSQHCREDFDFSISTHYTRRIEIMNVALPEVLYKYTKYSYAIQMLVEGTVRIGTLNDYRNENKHGLEIADKEEGTQTTRMGRFKPIDPKRSETIPPTMKRLIETGRIRFDPGIENFTIYGDVREATPDVYVYSLSIDKNVITAFEEATYDSIIEITNPVGLHGTLTHRLRLQSCSKGYDYNAVEYIKREQDIETQTPTHPVYVKDPCFSRQKEYRFIWDAGEEAIQPIILKCPEIKKFIKPICLPHVR